MEKFAERLMGLLPEIYSQSDSSEDLATFFAVVGPTLDTLKERIDGIPKMISPEGSIPDFLGYLAALVGAEYDPKSAPIPQRQRIEESLERYRRTGTTSGLARELHRLGWNGEIVETFRLIMRLNYRAKLNHQKLPGRRYNHGIYGITKPLEAEGFTEITKRHQPAGTIMWIGEENL